MLGYIAHGIAAVLARIWLATSAQSWRNLPTPATRALVHAHGPDPDRVLLLGSGITVGYGVVSHDLALGGNLARELGAQTGRGASVQVIGQSDLTPSNALRAAAVDLQRFDAVVLTLGGFEALTLMPPQLWRRRLRALLDEVRAEARPSLPLALVQASAPLIAGLPGMFRNLILASVDSINRQTRELCSEMPGTVYLAFAPAQGDVSSLEGTGTYRGWAALIAPAVGRALDEHGRVRHPESLDEASRQIALDSLDVEGASTPELDRIVLNVRDLLGASGAAVTIIDRDTQFTRAAVGMRNTSVPREESICDLTIRNADLLVIEDIMADPRLAGSHWVDGVGARFYAGYPLESPDGQRVGALCVIDGAPRTFSDTEASLLREFALQAQSALWPTRSRRNWAD